MAPQPVQTTSQQHGYGGNIIDYRRTGSGNPYAAEKPRGNVPNLPGNPWADTVDIPSGAYDDPKSSGLSPATPAVPPWEATSSSEFYRTHTDRYYAADPQGSLEQPQGTGGFARQTAPDPKWTPAPVIRPMHVPAGGQLYGRPFDQKMTRRLSGEHHSMAGWKRSYQLIPGERPVHQNVTTYRIVPPTTDEQLASMRGQPQLVITPSSDRSQNGTWRLI